MYNRDRGTFNLFFLGDAFSTHHLSSQQKPSRALKNRGVPVAMSGSIAGSVAAVFREVALLAGLDIFGDFPGWVG